MEKIQMVDLLSQYKTVQEEMNAAILDVIQSTRFIKGPVVHKFENDLAKHLDVKHVISCANGTDALQIALMALGLEPGDEVIVPAFTYAATAEVIGLLRLHPVMVDVDFDSFNTTAALVEGAITSKTKAIVPVHLYGQSSDMEDLMALARRKNLYVVEDNAQAIDSTYTFKNGTQIKTGTIGDIGCTSFFPSKNLGCYGDGGAMFTNNYEFARKLQMISNHGQEKKYHHSMIGVNSRLDALQAAVLNIKLKYLNQYSTSRQNIAERYDEAFKNIEQLLIPNRSQHSSHVFHQYTLRITDGRRDELKEYLQNHGIPSMIYYPIPLYNQKAFQDYHDGTLLPNTEKLCKMVLSLPIHTEMKEETLEFIVSKVQTFFNS